MFNPVTSTLTGINFGISTDPTAVGMSGYGVLMNSLGVILATTNTITLTAPMLGTTQNFPFVPWQTLTSGTLYYIGMAQLVTGYPAGAYAYPYLPANTYFSTAITGGAFTAVPPNFGYFDVEAVFSPTLNISVSPSVTCSGSTATLNVAGPTSYVWSQGNSPLGSNQSISVSPLISTVYSVTGTNTLGCNYSASINLSVNPLPNVAISSGTNAICLGNSISFTAIGAASYSLNNVAAQPAIVQTPLTNTVYSIIGIDANGCVNTTSIGITVFSLTVIFPSNTAICKGKTVTLSAASPFTYGYNWNDGSVVNPFQNASFTPTITTTYTVTATDVNNCSLSSTVVVTVNPNPTVTAVADRSVICKGEAVTLTASGAATYTWNNTTSGQSVTLSPSTSTTYVVMGATGSGCTNSVIIAQIVAACTALNEGKISDTSIRVFPNPNNGSFNSINCESFEQNKTMEIYNTLGALVKRLENKLLKIPLLI